MIVAVMIVAIATVHWQHGLFAQNNGIELPLIYSAAAAAIALIGNGAYSLDALLGLSWPAEVVWTALGLGYGRLRESRDSQDRSPRRLSPSVKRFKKFKLFNGSLGSKMTFVNQVNYLNYLN